MVHIEKCKRTQGFFVFNEGSRIHQVLCFQDEDFHCHSENVCMLPATKVYDFKNEKACPSTLGETIIFLFSVEKK